MPVETVDLPALIEEQKTHAFQIVLAAMLCAFMVLEGYDMQVLGYAAPAMIREMHSSKAAFGTVFGGAMVGFMIGALVFANLGDTLGRKKAILGGMLLFGIFTLGSAAASNIPVLLVMRTLAGIGLGGAVPNAVALMSEYAPQRTRARYIAILYLGYTGGSALGGLLAAKIIPTFGWQSAFLVGGALPLLLALLLILKLPESVRLMALRGGGQERILEILRKLRPDLSFAASVRIQETEEVRQGVPARHLFTGSYGLVSLFLWVGCIGNMMTHHFLTSWLPTVIEESGVSLSHAIIAASLMQGMGSLGGLIICWCIDRFGVTGVAGSLLLGVPCMLGFAGAMHSEPLMMAFAGGIGFFLIGSQTGLNAIGGTVYPTFMRSTGAGWANGMGRIGAILGPMAGGVLLSAQVDRSFVFLLAALPVIVAAAALFMLGRQPAVRPYEPRAANRGAGAQLIMGSSPTPVD